jgi:hypothetical protein
MTLFVAVPHISQERVPESFPSCRRPGFYLPESTGQLITPTESLRLTFTESPKSFSLIELQYLHAK